MVSNSEEEEKVTTKSDETSEDSKSTSSSGIVTDCSSNSDGDDNSSSNADEYVWTLSEELREFAEKELGETDEVRRISSSLVNKSKVGYLNSFGHFFFHNI